MRLPSGGYDLPLTDNADPLTTYSTFKITNQRSKIIQHCPKWSKNSDLVALVFLVLVAWAIGYSVFGNDVVGLHSQLFSLVASILSITNSIQDKHQDPTRPILRQIKI